MSSNQGHTSPDERRQNKRLSQQEYRDHEAGLLSQLAERVPNSPTRRGDILQAAIQWIDTLCRENQTLRSKAEFLERNFRYNGAASYPHSHGNTAMSQVYPGQSSRWNPDSGMHTLGNHMAGHAFIPTNFQGDATAVPVQEQWINFRQTGSSAPVEPRLDQFEATSSLVQDDSSLADGYHLYRSPVFEQNHRKN